MSAAKAISLRLDPEDRERLEAEAQRLGLSPATLARAYVHVGLLGSDLIPVGGARRADLAVLERLSELRHALPDDGSAVDVVRVIAEGREERDRYLGN
jgi:hypothetical protein